jgi:hypothetical protein
MKRIHSIAYLNVAFALLCTINSVMPLSASAANWWMAKNVAPVYPPTPAAASQRVTYLRAMPTPLGNLEQREGLAATLPVAVPKSALGVMPQWLPYTANNTLALAMAHLSESAEGQASLNLIQQNRGKVLFKNLSELNPQFADYDALAWMDAEGNWLLFINEKHATAPSYALAALVSHEAMHGDAYNSKQEEAEAWNREAVVWEQFRANHPELNNPSLERYPLVKRLNRIAVAHQQQQLTPLVKQHPSYAGLPETSPMFSNTTVVYAPSAIQAYSSAPVPQPDAYTPTPITSEPYQYYVSSSQPPTSSTGASQVQYPPKRSNPNDIFQFPPIKTAAPVVMAPAQTAYAPTAQQAMDVSNKFANLKKPTPAEMVMAQPITGLRLKPIPYRVDAYHAAAPTISFNWLNTQVPTP